MIVQVRYMEEGDTKADGMSPMASYVNGLYTKTTVFILNCILHVQTLKGWKLSRVIQSLF